eukprot:jgi/Mesvir1/29264/Mv08182-RA.1
MSLCSSHASLLRFAATIILCLGSVLVTATDDSLHFSGEEWESTDYARGPWRGLLQSTQGGEQGLIGPEGSTSSAVTAGSQLGGAVAFGTASSTGPSQLEANAGRLASETQPDIVDLLRHTALPASTTTQPSTLGTMPQGAGVAGADWAAVSTVPDPQSTSGSQSAASTAAGSAMQRPMLLPASHEGVRDGPTLDASRALDASGGLVAVHPASNPGISTSGGLVAVHPATDPSGASPQLLGGSGARSTLEDASRGRADNWDTQGQALPSLRSSTDGASLEQMRFPSQDSSPAQSAARLPGTPGTTLGDPRKNADEDIASGVATRRPEGWGNAHESPSASWDAALRDWPRTTTTAAAASHQSPPHVGGADGEQLARPEAGPREHEGGLPWHAVVRDGGRDAGQDAWHAATRDGGRDAWQAAALEEPGGRGSGGGAGILSSSPSSSSSSSSSSSPARDPSLAALQELFANKNTLSASQDPWVSHGGDEKDAPPSQHPGPATSFNAATRGARGVASLDGPHPDQASLWHKLVHGTPAPSVPLRGGVGGDSWGIPHRDVPGRFDVSLLSSSSPFGTAAGGKFDDEAPFRTVRGMSSPFLSSPSSSSLSSSRSSSSSGFLGHSSLGGGSRLNVGSLLPSGALPSVRDVASSGGDWRTSTLRPDPVHTAGQAARGINPQVDEEDAELAGPVRLAGFVPRRCELPFKVVTTGAPRAGLRGGGRALLSRLGSLPGSGSARAGLHGGARSLLVIQRGGNVGPNKKPVGTMRPLPLYNANTFTPKTAMSNYNVNKPRPSEIRKAAEAAAHAAASATMGVKPSSWSKVTGALPKPGQPWDDMMGPPPTYSRGMARERRPVAMEAQPLSDDYDYNEDGGSGYSSSGARSSRWGDGAGGMYEEDPLPQQRMGGPSQAFSAGFGGANSRPWAANNPNNNRPNQGFQRQQPGMPTSWHSPQHGPAGFPNPGGMGGGNTRPGGIQQSFVDEQGRFRTVRAGIMPNDNGLAMNDDVGPWAMEEPRPRLEVRPVVHSPPPPSSPPPSPPPPPPSPPPPQEAPVVAQSEGVIPLSDEELRRKREVSTVTPSDESAPVFHAPTGSAYVAAIVRSLFRPVVGESCFEAAIACSKHGTSFGITGWHSNTRHAAGSCAVVGDRRDVLNFEMGNEIDAHATVVRMGWHPTIGHERQIGTKTDLVVVNETMLEGHADGDRPTFKLAPGFLSTPRVVWVDARRMRDMPIMGRVSSRSSRFIQGKAYVTTEALVGGPTGADEMYEQLKQFVEENEELDVELIPSIYLEVITTLIGSQLCRTIDVYGLGNVGGGPYLSTTYEGHRREALAPMENFIFSVGMANGFLCVRS